MKAELLTAEEVAAKVRRSIGTLYQWRYHGKGPVAFSTGGKGGKLVYRREDVDEWIAQQREAEARRQAERAGMPS